MKRIKENNNFDILIGVGIFTLIFSLGMFLLIKLCAKWAKTNNTLKALPSLQELGAPEFENDAFVFRFAKKLDGVPVSVIVDRASGMIHFHNCFIASRSQSYLAKLLEFYSSRSRVEKEWHSCPISDIHYVTEYNGGRYSTTRLVICSREGTCEIAYHDAPDYEILVKAIQPAAVNDSNYFMRRPHVLKITRTLIILMTIIGTFFLVSGGNIESMANVPFYYVFAKMLTVFAALLIGCFAVAFAIDSILRKSTT